MATRVERFMAHLDRLGGGQEPRFLPVEPTRPGHARVTALIYTDHPEPGLLTGVTYGLSLAEHPLWLFGKKELTITVRSRDSHWGFAIAFLAERLQGDCPFEYGNTVNFGEPISAESAMSAFAVFGPATLEAADSTIDVGDTTIGLAGCYPIHNSEMNFITEHGLEDFWKLDWDPYDVSRSPVA